MLNVISQTEDPGIEITQQNERITEPSVQAKDVTNGSTRIMFPKENDRSDITKIPQPHSIEPQSQNIHGAPALQRSEGAFPLQLHPEDDTATQLQNTQTQSEIKELRCSPEFHTKSGNPKKKPIKTTDKRFDTDQYANIWHRRLRHVSLPILRKILRQQEFPNIPTAVTFQHCEVCALSKLTEKTYDQTRRQGTRPGEIIYADIIGPITPQTFPNKHRFILTIDSFSRYAQVFPLMKKSQTKQYLKIVFNRIRSQFPTPGQIRILQTDQGTEFTNTSIKQLLIDYGITHELSEKFVSEHNGLKECFNRTIQERARELHRI